MTAPMGNVVRRAAIAGVWLLALALCISTWHSTKIWGAKVGLDLQPIWGSTQSLLHGRSVYASNSFGQFVYLPTTTLLMLPLAALGEHAALRVALAIEIASLSVALVIAVTPLERHVRRWAAPLSIAIIMVADLTRDTLFAGNFSLLVAPLAVLALLRFERERWRAGCALLVISLLVKPMLIPLFLIPVLRRRWRDLAVTLLPAAVLVAILVVVLPGGDHIIRIVTNVLNPPSLHAHSSTIAHNISLHGVGARLGLAGPFLVARLAVVAAAIAAVAVWMRRAHSPGATAAAGAALLLAVMLAGNLSERNYLFVAFPCVLLAVTLCKDRNVVLAAVPAAILMLVPRRYLGHVAGSSDALQVRYMLAAVLLFIGALRALNPGWGSTGARIMRRWRDAGALRRRVPSRTAHPADLEHHRHSPDGTSSSPDVAA